MLLTKSCIIYKDYILNLSSTCCTDCTTTLTSIVELAMYNTVHYY